MSDFLKLMRGLEDSTGPLQRNLASLQSLRAAERAVELATRFDSTSVLQQLESMDVSRSVKAIEQSSAHLRLIDSLSGIQESLKFQDALRAVTDVIPWLPTDSMDAVLAQYTARTQHIYDAIFSSTSFAGVLGDIERLRPVVEEHRHALVAAEDEASRYRALGEIVVAVFEAVSGAAPRWDTPYARRVTVARVFVIVIMLVLFCRETLDDNSRDRAIAELQRSAIKEVEAIAAVAETVRQVQERQESDSRAPSGPILRVTRAENLRAGPSPETPRVSKILSGDDLEFVLLVGPWYYVERLTHDGQRTGIRGWIHRKRVEFVR